MSVVAGYTGTDHVMIGAESEERIGHMCTHDLTKIVRVGPCVVGFYGLSLWGRFLRSVDHTELCHAAGNLARLDGVWVDGEPSDPAAWYHWTCALADAWATWAKGRGHGSAEDGVWGLSGGLLAATPGGLLSVGSSCAVRERLYFAIGSGAEVAMGSLWNARRLYRRGAQMDARTAVDFALSAAIEHSPGCGGWSSLVRVELRLPRDPNEVGASSAP